MTTEGYSVDAGDLPTSEFVPTLSEARRLYVVRAFSNVGVVNHSLEDPYDERYLGSATHTLPNLWDAELEYCQRVNEMILGDIGDKDPVGLVRLEDRARLREYRTCTKLIDARMKTRRVRKVARCIPVPIITGALPDNLKRDNLANRTHHLLQAERSALEYALAA